MVSNTIFKTKILLKTNKRLLFKIVVERKLINLYSNSSDYLFYVKQIKI